MPAEAGNPIVTIDPATLFEAVNRVEIIIREMFEAYAKEHPNNPPAISFRNDCDINPYFNQTSQGIFLEYCYGKPARFWTPWGQYEFCDGASGHMVEELNQTLLSRLDATLYLEVKNTRAGCIGPVYAIHGVDELKLPEPQVRDPLGFVLYKECEAEWERLKSANPRVTH